MQKTENDYIAEYVKQKHPEILQSLDFMLESGACINRRNRGAV